VDGNMNQIEIDFAYLDILTSILSKITFSGVSLLSVECCIAGGAIRDMLLQKPISDIDVFYTGELKEGLLKNTFKTVEVKPNSYPDGFNVTHTVGLAALPVPIQLIQVESIEKHIGAFPSPLLRVQYNFTKGLEGIDADFISDANAKIFCWDHKADLPYFLKIKSKYSDWKHTFLKDEYNPELQEELSF